MNAGTRSGKEVACGLLSQIHVARWFVCSRKKWMLSCGACLRLVLQSLCDFFPPSGTLLDLSGPFLSAGKGVLRYSVTKCLTFPWLHVGSGFHCLRSFSFLRHVLPACTSMYYVTPSLNHAGCVITTSGSSFLFVLFNFFWMLSCGMCLHSMSSCGSGTLSIAANKISVTFSIMLW